jgi:hypothetical protein
MFEQSESCVVSVLQSLRWRRDCRLNGIECLGRELIKGEAFEARECGDQVLSADPQETVWFSRSRRKKMAHIHRACGGLQGQNCLATAPCLDGRQGGMALSVIFGPAAHQMPLFL